MSSKSRVASENSPTSTVTAPVTTAPTLVRSSMVETMPRGTDKFHREFNPFDPYSRLMEEYGTVLECMDGRSQRKVADYLTTSFGVRNLDTITTAGAVRHLAENTEQTKALLDNLAISIGKHGSNQIAVVAHHDCLGNPVADNTQKTQLSQAISRIRDLYPHAEVTGLWLNAQWIVERVGR